MADDLSWIDHPANLRANAVLLRAVADQLLLHATEFELMRAALQTTRQYIKDEMIAHALVMIEGKPESEWPTLGAVIDRALGEDGQCAGTGRRESDG